MPKHPIQPLVRDSHGTVRFKENAIVRHLLDTGSADLNRLACLPFSDEDREQFAQLIGYSLDGFGMLSYASNEVYAAATLENTGETESLIHREFQEFAKAYKYDIAFDDEAGEYVNTRTEKAFVAFKNGFEARANAASPSANATG